jgi:uncharacterized membrane protein YGL010W
MSIESNCKMLRIEFGQAGIDLYRELHLNETNAYLHAAFMPFVVAGIFRGLPALLKMYGTSALRLQYLIFVTYIAYYASFDIPGAAFACVYYIIPLLYATNALHTERFRGVNIEIGLWLLLFSLGIQEFIGHSMFEHKNSDLWQIPNSILIAPIFGSNSAMQWLYKK